MQIESILEHRDEIAATLAAAAVFGMVGVLAWPMLAGRELSRRLREQVSVGAAHPSKRRQDRAETRPAVGLRGWQPESLARVVSIFRIGDWMNAGRLVENLQQAGYRGRGALLQYLAARIVSPLAMTGAAGMFVLLSMPHEPVYIRVGILAAGGIFGWFLPAILLKNRIDKRRVEIGRAWPDAVDLLLICVETGMSIEHAFRKVSEEMAATSIELAKEMTLTNAELAYLKERRQAYENLARRVQIDGVRAVATSLIQSERYGTPVGQLLRVIAQESRAMRMAAAEKKAAALPPKLTVPMIIFFLPVLFAVIITPAALQIMGS